MARGKGGRPKAKLDSLPEGWQDAILNLYSEGASDVEVKAWIWKQRKSFSDSLWARWLKEEDEFSSTIKKGRQLCAAWWERKGRQGIDDKSFNSTLWYMNMKNRFGWKDKQEQQITGADSGPVKIEVNIKGSKSKLME